MNPHFNLIDEPWIPCIFKEEGNGKVKDLGLFDTLVRAHEIEGVSHQSPLITASVQRLLLAIIHRNFGPEDSDAWTELWKRGKYESDALSSYFERWKDRFYLVHEDHPFYQVSGYEEKKTNPVTKLAQEMASGNNEILFDHHQDNEPLRATCTQAAKLVVANQAFSVGEAQGRLHAPMTHGASVLLNGRSLFETLLMNLVIYNPENQQPQGIPSTDSDSDKPHWERDEKIVPKSERHLTGYLDYLTWQSRAIRLLPTEENERLYFNTMYFGQGIKWPKQKEKGPEILDPSFAIIYDEKRGSFPIKIKQERELWRDSSALFQVRGSNRRAPLAIVQMAEHVNNELPLSATYNVDVFGLCTDKANVHLWRHSRMPLPAIALKRPEIVNTIDLGLEKAESGWRVIREIIKTILKELYSPEVLKDREIYLKWLHIYYHYWSYLETPFKEWFLEISDKALKEDLDIDKSLSEWIDRSIKPAVKGAYSKIESNIVKNSMGFKICTITTRIMLSGLKSLENKEDCNG